MLRIPAPKGAGCEPCLRIQNKKQLNPIWFDVPVKAFLDPVSGKAYMVYSQHTCGGQAARAMKLLLLDDDWTAPAPGAAGEPVPTVAAHIEAPCPFYSELTKKHYIWSSHTSGWKPNAAELLVSSDGMDGPWSSLGNPSSNVTTFSTQGSHIEKLPGPNPPGVEKFLYVGDRYEPYINTTEGSRYIFLALEVSHLAAHRFATVPF